MPDRPSRPPVEACREQALRLLDRRAHSVAELRRKLMLRKHAPTVIAAVLEDLQRHGLVNDTAFAAAWIEEKRRATRPVGWLRIQAQLRGRGVTPDAIAAAAPGDEALPGDAEEEEVARALAALRQKLKSARPTGDPRADRARLCRFLAQRGFTGDIVRKALDRVRQDDTPDVD